MSPYAKNQIFFDRTNKRWYFTRVFLSAFVLIAIIIYGTMFLSVIREPSLPKANLSIPSSALRSAPPVAAASNNLQNAVKTSAGNLPASSLPSPDFQPAFKPALAVDALKSDYNPKIIGFYVNWDDTSFTSLENNIGTLDELIPEWLHLGDENGNIVVDDQVIQDITVRFIKEKRPRLPIAPLVNNFDQNLQDWNSDMLDKMLRNPASRTRNIQSLLDYVKQNNFAGISIDYENVPDLDQPFLAAYMGELYAKFYPLGLEVTQNIPLDDPAFDAIALSQYCDQLILMAYDEHSVGSDQAGPLASQKWFVDSLNSKLAVLPPSKFIVALGNYGYDWYANSTDGKTYTYQDAMLSASESGTKTTLDPVSLNPTYSYFDGDTLHNVWFLDATSTFNEISAMKNLPIHGYALWRLGSEDPSVWKVFRNPLDLGSSGVRSLSTLSYGYDINYEGRGEVMRVIGTPHSGIRDLVYHEQAKLILQEEITKYPDSFTVYRWGSTSPKKIALTFDDGPDPRYTPKILEILNRYGAKATFFVIGANATQNQEILRQTAADGNEVGNHTFTHPNVTSITDGQFSFELNSTQSLLASIIGRHSLLFRPPYAEDIEPVTPDQIRPLEFATSEGYYTVGMHIDPNDWQSPGTEEIVSRVVDSAVNGEGNIVLLHDGGGDRSQTILALPKIIEQLRAKGFEIVTISDLMGVPKDSIMPPVSSDNRVVSAISGGAFLATGWGTSSLYFLFMAGILLGVARFVFVAILAIIQKIRQYFEKSPEYIEKFSPSVAVLIPALNEEKVIQRTVSSVLASTYQNLEIIVIDDGSTDKTLDRLAESFSGNPKVKIYSKANMGKWAALNFGIERTQAQILVTLDADTIFRPTTIERLIPYFADYRVGAVAGNTKVGNRNNLLTRWQALEYITSQNLDRRAFDMMNCISVVPGSVGAWRRRAVLEAGGFSGRTLAEDADLTFSINRLGYRVKFQARAIAYTEAPDNMRDFVKQRFRWMFGTLQTAWKHIDTLFRPKYGFLGFFAVPNILVFQVIFPLISPLMDFTILTSLSWALWQSLHHPVDYSAFFALQKLFTFYLLFLAIDFLTSAVAFALEKSEDWKLLIWLVPQRFLYRQLMYYVAIKVFLTALKGRVVGWGKIRRTATVSLES